MALSAIEIYKLLPQTNCGDCGVPTCLAFAMKIAQKQASLDDCPHVSDEAKAALGEASAPPMATVTIGTDDHAIEVGGETVAFRHEETFYHPCAIAIAVDCSLSDDEITQCVQQIDAIEFDRVGMTLGIDLIALRDSGEGRLARAAELATQTTNLPLVLMSTDPETTGRALEVCGETKPLIYGAAGDNLEAMVELATKYDCPLSLRANGLDELVDMSEKASQAGAKDLLLDSTPQSTSELLVHQTAIRRATLDQSTKALRYPTIVAPAVDSEKPLGFLQVCTAVAKYASVIIVDTLRPELLLPIITARLNIYTDPQKPLQVEQRVSEVGEPDENSPVLITTNFSLTYYSVEGDVSAGKIDAYILPVNTDGTSVLTAWAAGDFTPEIIAKAIVDTGLEDIVAHREVILPGGVAVLQGKLEQESGWQVAVGPRESSGIPQFFRERRKGA